MLNEDNLFKKNNYRIIPSVYPPINFFENIIDPSEMETLWEIESLTNERLREEAGDIFLVKPEDRLSGPGSSIIMAAFTHIGRPTRFSDGSFGIYYAGFSLKTAIQETKFHREQFLTATNQMPTEITMRVYQSHLQKKVYSIIKDEYQYLHHPNEHHASQLFGTQLKVQGVWGILYNSVRDKGGHCVAVLRPPAIAIPTVLTHLRYCWNGQRITNVFEIKSMLTQQESS